MLEPSPIPASLPQMMDRNKIIGSGWSERKACAICNHKIADGVAVAEIVNGIPKTYHQGCFNSEIEKRAMRKPKSVVKSDRNYKNTRDIE